MLFNKLIIKTLPLVPKSVVHIFAKKYIAGETLSDSILVSQHIENEGGTTTIDVLGEFITTKVQSLHEKEMCSKVLTAISENQLKSYLSVKPTSLGLGIDKEFAFQNIYDLVQQARNLGIFVRLDMENSPYTSCTLDIYRKLRAKGYDNIGVVIQAYLYRSEQDILDLAHLKPSIRLCKGIYVEDKSIAIKEPEEIRRSFKKLLRLMIDNGIYPAIATHDEPLILDALQLIEERKLSNEVYEFQMLLGVREERRRQLIKMGHPVRVYVPFGKDWYGYSTRRMKENPHIAGQIFKAIFIKN